MPAPTLVAFALAEGSVTSGTAVTTASVSWQIGDVVTVVAGTDGSAGGEVMPTPTTSGSGLSFGTAQQLHQSTGTDAGLGVWAAVATAASSGTVSFAATHAGVARHKFVGVYVGRGSAGIGNSAITATPSSTKTVSLTPTAADGLIVWSVSDWNADAVVAFSPSATTHSAASPGPTASPVNTQLAGVITFYVGDLDDQTSAGAASYGVGGAGVGPFTILAIEMKASAGGAATIPASTPRTVPSRDPGEAWWLQRDRRDANTTGTAANPLPSPLGLGGDVQRAAARWPLPFAAGAVYGQRDRRDANTLGAGPTNADPLTLPDAIARQRMPADFTADRRLVPQQPQRLADQSSPPPVLFDPTLAGPSRTATATPATHTDRRLVPAQRVVQAAPDDVVTVGTGALGAWWSDDAAVAYMAGNLPRPPVPQPAAPVLFDPTLAGIPAWLESAASWHTPTAGQQRPAVVDQSTAPPPLFDPTLSGFPAWLEYEPATHWRPAGPPVQRGPVADQSTSPPVLFDPTQAGLLGWLLNEAATHWRTSLPQQRPVFADPTLQPQSDPTLFAVGPGRVAVTWPVDRREVPQQRPYVSDPSFYPTVAPTDPLTVAYGAGGTYWLLYNTAALTVDRREVPQQRPYRSDPPLLASSLLENELLGGAGTMLRALVPATHTDRREVPAQRPVFVQLLPPVPADPTLLGYLVARIARTWATPDGRTWRPQQRAVLFAYGATPPYVRAGRLTVADRPVSHLTQAAATTGRVTGSARSTASLTPDTT
jgi:hypothetical protein